jgi:hypothetical protein
MNVSHVLAVKLITFADVMGVFARRVGRRSVDAR